ncbi:MAG: ATP-binding protein, partial [Gammaproteobacteria bacterium]|nr:ATP-binding protein [Gammaproteobacteria bacterium]
GEAVLAHNGVLFLDELPHFKPSALDFLREPIETGEAVITRAKYTVRYPCSFQLVAAMNPCPAGRVCRQDACRCSPAQVHRYQSRISGPMLDRIDIQIQVPALPRHVLISLTDSQDTPAIQLRSKVAAARQRQIERQQTVNAKLSGTELKPHMDAAKIDEGLLNQAVEQYQLSARSYQKLWRVARTIADLEGLEKVTTPHLTEALSYRSLEWERGVS